MHHELKQPPPQGQQGKMLVMEEGQKQKSPSTKQAPTTPPRVGPRRATSKGATPIKTSTSHTVGTSRSQRPAASPAPTRPAGARPSSDNVMHPSKCGQEQAAPVDEQSRNTQETIGRPCASGGTIPPRRWLLASAIALLLAAGCGYVNDRSHRRATAFLAEARTSLRNHQKQAALRALDSTDAEGAWLSRSPLCHMWHCHATRVLLAASLLRAQVLESPPANLDAALSEIERALTLLGAVQVDDDAETTARELALMEGRIHHRRGHWLSAVLAFGRVEPRLLRAEAAHMRLLCESQMQTINGSLRHRSNAVDEWLGTKLERVACGNGPCGAHRTREPDGTSAVWCAEAKLQECRLQSARKEYTSVKSNTLHAARCIDPRQRPLSPCVFLADCELPSSWTRATPPPQTLPAG